MTVPALGTEFSYRVPNHIIRFRDFGKKRSLVKKKKERIIFR
jgi:hypothetical protein